MEYVFYHVVRSSSTISPLRIDILIFSPHMMLDEYGFPLPYLTNPTSKVRSQNTYLILIHAMVIVKQYK